MQRITIAEKTKDMSESQTINFMIGALDAQQYTIDKQQRKIEALERQVERLLAAVPSAGMVEGE